MEFIYLASFQLETHARLVAPEAVERCVHRLGGVEMADLPRIGRRALLLAAASAAVAVVTLSTGGAAVAAPVGTVVGESSPTAIAGKYVVVLKSSAVGTAGSMTARSGMRGTAQSLAKRYGGVVGDVYDAALTGFSVALTPGQARRLAADASVAYVEQD